MKNSTEYTGEAIDTQSVDTDKILKEQICRAVVLTEAQKSGLEATKKHKNILRKNFEIANNISDETNARLI